MAEGSTNRVSKDHIHHDPAAHLAGQDGRASAGTSASGATVVMRLEQAGRRLREAPPGRGGARAGS